MKPEYIDIAKQSVLFSSAPPDMVQTILSASSVREFERGATIFMQNEEARSIFVVLSGWVKLYRITPNGAEAIVGVFTKGRSFGEAAAFRDDVYPVAAEAATDCKLLQISAHSFLHHMRKEPDLCLSILASTFAHLHSLVEQVEHLKAHTGAQRVAEFLCSLSDDLHGNSTVTLPYDKVLIAGRLGMKPESLSRSFGRLRSLGVSVDKNHAVIEDMESLRRFAEVDDG